MSEHVKVSTPQKKNTVPASNQSKNIPTMQGSRLSTIIQRAQVCPESLTHADVMQLQRTIGNRAVMQLFKDISSVKSVQKKESVQEKENSTGLPDNLKIGVENLSGLDMSDVQVHYNSNKPAQLGALAYAQGVDIHVAPSMERHLPHEAWHVVQQKQGRVKPTIQMQGKISINDDAGLEKEADVMGIKVLSMDCYTKKGLYSELSNNRNSGLTTSSSTLFQLMNATRMGPIAAYTDEGDTDLYNIPGGLNLPKGILFTRSLGATNDAGAAIDAYIREVTVIGSFVRDFEFLDKNVQPPDVPKAAKFNNLNNDFHKQFKDWAKLDDNHINTRDRNKMVDLREKLTLENRLASRNNSDIGLIDPFVTQITIPQEGAKPWIFKTNWSESANSYITEVTVGSKNLTGRIRDAGSFADIENLKPWAQEFQYSSAHALGVDHTVGEQIEGMKRPGLFNGPTNRENNEGFDAVTKIAAEGARFIPVRNLGLYLKQNSRFYHMDALGNVTILTFQQLYANWRSWFGRRYGITSTAVLAEVRNHGALYNGLINLTSDYDLDNDDRAFNLQPIYKDYIVKLVDQLDELKNRRTKIIQRHPQDMDERLRGINRQINSLNADLMPYKRSYPDLVKASPQPVVQPQVQVDNTLCSFFTKVGISIAVGATITVPLLYKYGYLTGEYVE